MKKYIYTLLLLLLGSFSYAQNESVDNVKWHLHELKDLGPLTIPTTPMSLQAIEIKKIPPSICEFDLVGAYFTDGFFDNVSQGRQDASVIIDGIRVRSESLLPNDCDLPLTIVYENAKSISSISSGPGTGLEGHNFVENPAIIYPNPVKDIMSIKSTDPITVIEILNAHGEAEKNMDSRNELLDVSDLPAGVYYVRIHFENKKTVQVEKILVVK